MFNLLPDSIKSDVHKEYNHRRLIVFLVFVISLQITMIIFLFPSWVLSNIKQDDNKTAVSLLDSKKAVSNSDEIKPLLKSLNGELSMIDKSLEYPKSTLIFNLILTKKTGSIKINQFSYSSVGPTTTINIRGISSTRESLVNFKSELEKSGSFISVDLPISNYAKDRNLDFNMSAVVSNK